MMKLWILLVFILLSIYPYLPGGGWVLLEASVWIETTREDFADGRFPVTLYVSEEGAVRMTSNLRDLNQDGYLDIVFSNYSDGSSIHIKSYIYWGPDFLTRQELETHGALGNSLADLNRDGYLDLVFSNNGDSISHDLNSYIYWGPDFLSKQELETHGAHGNSVADVNNDGYLDIVFSNAYSTLESSFCIDSYIYWGPDFVSRQGLPTLGAKGNSVADLNNDGYLDIVFSNTTNGQTQEVNSYIYWGPDFLTKKELPTLGARGNSVADLNGDGYLDLVFSNCRNDSTYNVFSYIYWGPDFTERRELPTHGAKCNSVADLNGDGYLDIVFSNSTNDSTHNIFSYVYWGPDFVTRLGLSTHGARPNYVLDLNGDGFLDIVFGNSNNDTTPNLNSYIYWGPDFLTKQELETHGTGMGTETDLGDLYDRSDSSLYFSSVFDAGSSGVSWGIISWVADTSLGSWLKVAVRAGNTPSPDQSWSDWVWVGNGEDLPSFLDNARYLQYKAVLGTDFKKTPVLEEIMLEYSTYPFNIDISLYCSNPDVPQGGDLVYEAKATNLTLEDQPFQYWAKVKTPSGKWRLVVNPRQVHLGAGETKTRSIKHSIPLNARLGEYEYWGFVGPDTLQIWDKDYFTFTIVPKIEKTNMSLSLVEP